MVNSYKGTMVLRHPLLRFICTLLTLSLVTVGCSGISGKAKELVGQPAPYSRLYLLDGSEIPLDAEQGKHTLILFWATWCRHSKSAIEDFEELARDYRRRSDVTFLAVSIDRAEDFEALKERIKEKGLRTVTHAFSGNDVHDEAYLNFHGEEVPFVIAIDPRGVVRVVDSDVGSLEEYLRRLKR